MNRLKPLKGLLALLLVAGIASLAVNLTASRDESTPPDAKAEAAEPQRLTDADAAEAKAVAASFVEAFASYRYDEPLDAPVHRAAPFATTELITTLRSDNSGASALSEERINKQESLRVLVESVQIAAYTEGFLEVLVVTNEELRTTGGTETSTATLRLRLEKLDGWKVSEVIP